MKPEGDRPHLTREELQKRVHYPLNLTSATFPKKSAVWTGVLHLAPEEVVFAVRGELKELLLFCLAIRLQRGLSNMAGYLSHSCPEVSANAFTSLYGGIITRLTKNTKLGDHPDSIEVAACENVDTHFTTLLSWARSIKKQEDSKSIARARELAMRNGGSPALAYFDELWVTSLESAEKFTLRLLLRHSLSHRGEATPASTDQSVNKIMGSLLPKIERLSRCGDCMAFPIMLSLAAEGEGWPTNDPVRD